MKKMKKIINTFFVVQYCNKMHSLLVRNCESKKQQKNTLGYSTSTLTYIEKYLHYRRLIQYVYREFSTKNEKKKKQPEPFFFFDPSPPPSLSFRSSTIKSSQIIYLLKIIFRRRLIIIIECDVIKASYEYIVD